MYYYSVENRLAASFLKGLPFPAAKGGVPDLFLLRREDAVCRSAWRVTDARQLTAAHETVAWFDPRRMGDAPAVDAGVAAAIAAQTLTAVDIGHPQWRSALSFTAPKAGKKRLHLLAVGDVGGTLLTALKLLGGDVISAIGICDLSEKTVERWVTEMGQIGWPWDYGALPEVEAVDMDHLFDCDVFIFAATKAIPAVGSGVQDVRMAQLNANAGIVAHYARMARAAQYRGLFMVLSDPVDQLCQAAYHASNRGADGQWDGLGLLPEQVQGYGLGVMTSRAAYFAKKEPRIPGGRASGDRHDHDERHQRHGQAEQNHVRRAEEHPLLHPIHAQKPLHNNSSSPIKNRYASSRFRLPEAAITASMPPSMTLLPDLMMHTRSQRASASSM